MLTHYFDWREGGQKKKRKRKKENFHPITTTEKAKMATLVKKYF